MPIVKMPDGTLVDMPDNPTPELLAALKAKISSPFAGAKAEGSASPNEPGFLDKAWTEVKNDATGAYKGLLGVPAALSNLEVAGRRNFIEGQKGKISPERQALLEKGLQRDQQENQNFAMSGHIPTNPGEAYRQSIAGGVAGAMLGPGSIAQKALIGGVSGLASEGAGELTGSQFNPQTGQMEGGSTLARVGASLLGGGATGAAMTFSSTNAKRLAQEALHDVKPEDLAKAQAGQEAAHAAGIQTNIAQHMPTGSNLDAYVNTLANSQHGPVLTGQLRAQPRALEMAAENQLGKLPGSIHSDATIANNAQEAATTVIENGRKSATQAWLAHAPEGAAVSPTSVGKLDQWLKSMADAHPNTSIENLANDVRGRLLNPIKAAEPPPSILGANGLPMNAPPPPQKYLTDALQLKGAVSDALDTFGPRMLNTPSLAGRELQKANEIRQALKSIFKAEAKPLADADAAYSKVMDTVVDPLKKSVVGRIAQPLGALDDKEAFASKMMAVLDKGTLPGASTSEIRTFGKAVAKAGQPEVFADSVKTWFAKKIDAALQTKTLEAPEQFAEVLSSQLGSSATETARSRGVRDMMATVAENQGMNTKDTAAYVKGFEQFRDIISAAAKRPATVGGTNSQQIIDNSSKTATRGLGNVSVITPLRQPALWWSRKVGANSLQEMDRLLSSPEGVKMLITLGSKPAMSPAAVAAVNTFMGAVGAETVAPSADPEQNPARVMNP